MNRQTFNAMAAQYATPEVPGDGRVEWDDGKKCVIPSVKLYGAAVQDGEPTPDNPIMPVCNDGTFASRRRNLLDAEKCVPIKNTFGLTVAITEDGGIRVTGIMTAATGTRTFRIISCGFVWDESGALDANLIAFDAPEGYKLMWDAQTKSIIISTYLENGTFYDMLFYLMAYIGDVPTAYSPYYDGGTATAPELWAIPGTEYRDEWDAQTGRGVRRVKKLVLIPELNWNIYNAGDDGFDFAYISNIQASDKLNSGMFSHGKYVNIIVESNTKAACAYPTGILRVRVGREASVEDFKAFLQERIDANTPVTVWYPLAEPEPFYHPPARLTMPTGYGQIIQTGGSIADCPITAKYLTHAGGASAK